MPRFFVLPEKVCDGIITIDTEDVGHIRRVLRLGEGDKIEVCDTTGFDYEAEISEISEKSVICKVLSSKKSDTESDIKVTLYQGVPKGSKMDYIIEKTTELGVFRIVPVMMSRCVVKLEGEKAERKKQERWQKISVAAAKQSGRGIIPEITMPMSFLEAVSDMKKNELVLAPYECESTRKLRPVLEENKNAKSIAIMIGPEGGFDPKEIDELTNSGIKTVTLGKRILRTETAGEATLAMIMYEYGCI